MRPLINLPDHPSQTRLLSVLERLPYVVTDRAGTISEWSHGAAHLYGWSEHEALGTNASRLLGTCARDLSEPIDSTLDSEGEWRGELRQQRKDGSTIRIAGHWFADGASIVQCGLEIEDPPSGIDSGNIIEALPCAALLCRTDGTIVTANASCRELCAAGKPLPRNILHLDIECSTPAGNSRPAPQDGLVDLLRGDGLRNLTCRIRRPDSSSAVVELNAATLPSDGGYAGQVIIVMTEVTRHLRAHEDLLSHRTQLEAAFDSIQDSVLVFDSAGNVVLANRAAELNGHGSTRETRLDLEYYSRLYELRDPHGNVLPLDKWPITRALAGECFRNVEIETRRRDNGHERRISVSGGPVFDSLKQASLSIVVTRDITDQRRAAQALEAREEELRQRVEELQAVTEVAPVAIWVAHDRDCQHITGNQMANRFYEARSGENVSASAVGLVRRFFSGDQELPAQQLPMQVAVACNAEVRDQEIEVELPSGGRIVMLGHANPLRDAAGQVRGCVAAFLDITERKRGEEALRRREAEQRAILDATPAAVFVIDVDGTLFEANQEFLAMHDIRSKSELFTPEQRYAAIEAWGPDGAPLPAEEWPSARALRGEVVRNLELQVRLRHTGRTRIAMYNACPIRDAAGAIVGGVVVMIDITGMKRSTLELERMNRMIGMALAAGKSNAWELDLETRGLAWRREPRERRGTGADSVPSLDALYRLIHPEDRQAMRQTLRAAIRGGASECHGESRVILDSGIRWLEWNGLIVRDSQGTATRLIGISSDITDRKNATEQLDRMHRMVKLAHHAANAGVWEWNLETGDLVWSDELCELFNLDHSVEPSLRLLLSRVHAEDRAGFESALMAVVRDRQPEFRLQCRIVVANGIHWIESTGQLITDRTGSPVQMIGLSVDVTERKRLEQALTESNRDLQQFAYVASHDLQEPLRVISTYSSLLAKRNRGRLDAESETFIDYIVGGTARMNRLIRDLLQFSRLANTREDRRAPVDCSEALSAALGNLAVAIEESAAVIESERLPVVVGDESLLIHVFQNLVSNSLKYRHPERHPRVWISVERRDDCWLFSVRDNGIGFDMRFHDKIFKIFQRLHGPDEYSGTGIGLAIVRRIVEHHGGSIYARSEPDKGSTFYFSLPTA